MKRLIAMMLLVALVGLIATGCKTNRIVLGETHLPDPAKMSDATTLIIEDVVAPVDLLEAPATEDSFKSNQKLIEAQNETDSNAVKFVPLADFIEVDSSLSEDKEPTAPNITL